MAEVSAAASPRVRTTSHCGLSAQPLRGRGIERIRLTHRQRCLPHVSHYANNDVPRSIVGAADAQTLADRVLIWESMLRERLADEHGSHWCAEHVTLLKQTSPAERNAQRLEVARGHCIAIGVKRLGGVRALLELHAI